MYFLCVLCVCWWNATILSLFLSLRAVKGYGGKHIGQTAYQKANVGRERIQNGMACGLCVHVSGFVSAREKKKNRENETGSREGVEWSKIEEGSEHTIGEREGEPRLPLLTAASGAQSGDDGRLPTATVTHHPQSAPCRCRRRIHRGAPPRLASSSFRSPPGASRTPSTAPS